MKVLLDTHTLIWALEGSTKLSKTARRTIESTRNEVLVSAVSAWEIAIKKAMGKLHAPDDLEEAIDSAGFTKLSIGFSSVRRLEELPLHHTDPFDRMLIAQALEEGATVVTRDDLVARYAVKTLW